jgi:glycogen operon protein
VVIDENYNWEGDKLLKIPYHKTVIYEAHVKGFTKLNPDIPEDMRGTYTGIAHPASIEYLTKLGITAIELMPIHHFITDRHLQDNGLTNYWGYNSIGFSLLMFDMQEWEPMVSR